MDILELDNKSGIIKEAGKPIPIYQQIHKHLKLQITNGTVKPGDELPAISKMVKEWDVGYQAVTSAIKMLEEEGLIKFRNGKGRGKKPIVANIQTPEKQNTIMFIRTTNDFLDLQITQGISQYAKENNLEAIIVDSPPSHQAFIDSIKNPETDGIIILPYNHPDVACAINIAIEKGTEVVIVDRNLKDSNASSVSIDNVQGAYMASCHLLESHNRPVYYIGYGSELSSIIDRQHGWSVAMQEHNYHDIKQYTWIMGKDNNENSDYIQAKIGAFFMHQVAFCEKFFSQTKLDKYCIFALNDYMAKAIYFAAEKNGLSIGRDVFVAGFGNLPLCQNLPVPLTSIEQKNNEVGYEAAKLLYMKLNGSFNRVMHRKITPELIIRDSSAKTNS